MAKQKPLSREERRARRASIPEHRVYGLIVKDAGAASWSSTVVYYANTSDEAKQRREAWGFFSRNSSEMTPDDAMRQEYAFAADHPGEGFLSRFDDDGYSPWIKLPPGYKHSVNHPTI